GRYLYVSNLLDGLFQFDLNATNVAASRQTVAQVYAAALQLGPDCRIYIADGGLSAIPNPDLPAPACGYLPGAVSTSPGGSSYGLPMKVIYLDDYNAQITSTGSALCIGSSISLLLTGLSLYPQSIRWSFGDPASGTLDSTLASTTSPVTHVYNQAGQYVVRAVYEYECRLDTVYDTLVITTCNTIPSNCVAFQCTGAPQQWTVPSGVDTIRVKMWGAAGGAGPDLVGNAGGGGGFTEFTLPVVAGDVLQIAVGCGGQPAVGHIGGAGGWPAGGNGGSGNRVETVFGVPTDVGGAGGGGGLSLVRILGSQNALLGIAGAGGGGSFNRTGGAGGGLNADYTLANNAFNIFGFGGTQTAGGAPASNTLCPNPVSGTAGGFQQGGTGATDLGGGLADRTGGGGGGDGYYGGGGGSSHDGCFGVGSAGGGGSGFVCTTCPGLTGTTLTGGIAGTPANNTDPLLSAFPGVATGFDYQQGGNGLVYICYDSASCNPSTSSIQVDLCSTYTAPNGAVLTIPGLYVITIQNAAGCDSIISILLIPSVPIFGPPIIASACSTYTAPWGTTYSQSGTYFDTLTTAAGCDSILSLNLTITGSVSGTPIIASACSTYTAPWGTTYSQSGTYFDTLTTAAGCDSILSLNLTITGSVSGTPIIASACSMYTSPWGTTYSQSGTYFDTLTTAAGCDSILSLNLTITGSVSGAPVNASACDTYTAPWGTVYTQSGSYSDTLVAVNGCDSILTLNLTIDNSIVTPPLSVTACSTYTTPWGAVVDQDGIYSITLSGSTGCDSTVSISLTLSGFPSVAVTSTSAACGQSNGTADAVISGNGPYVYAWSNGSIGPSTDGLSSGNYTLTVTDANGCTASNTFSVSGTPELQLSVTASGTTVNVGDSVQLTANGATSYSWTPSAGLSCTDCPSPVAAPSQTTTYQVTGSDTNGCTATASLTIILDVRCNELFVPNIFSPDGEGPQENERLCVLSNCIESVDFAIYDRWGQLIFQTNDPQGCWDGRKDGKEVMTGVYAYR
ncbi:MAG: gliding motility-associated C-terminal domain-containing protein, partial [Bacteroidota bacterium]